MALFHTTVLDNQIKALPTVDTASGAIATFDTDLTENLIEVKCQIVAKQASGTPSPDNPLPITTYTEMNVGATGKNFWSNDKAVTDSNTSSVYITDEWLNFTTGQYRLLYNFTTSNRVTFSAIVKNKEANSNTVSIQARYSDNTNETIATITLNDQNEHTISGTTASGKTLVGFRTGWTDARQACMKEIQLEKGTTATTFEPFNGTTENIPFGQTVANGVLDISTGKLRVTDGVVKMADLVWVESEGIFTNRLSDGDLHTATRGSTNHCEIYKSSGATSSANMQDKSIQTMGGVGSANFWCKDTDYTTASDFINSLGDYKLVYPLATPIEIQLDSITLQALLNENNIWCDTGDTEVKFLLTVGKKIS